MKVYQAVLDQLIGAGVTYFSGMIGSTAAPYAATLADRNDMRYVGVRHEHTAASILDATARLTGKPGCLMVHGASGFLAASAGIASAALDSTPMFILSATQERRAMESGWWQTMNVQTPLSDVLKWQKRVERPDQAIEAVRAALREAVSGKPGVAQVDLPIDVSADDLGPGEVPEPIPVHTPLHRPYPDPALVKEAAALLRSAERPVLLVGGGAMYSGAASALIELAERLHMPVVNSPTSRNAVPETHPLVLGPSGIVGYEPVGDAIKEADLVLAIGSRLSDLQTARGALLPGDAPIIQVDIDSAAIGQNHAVTVGIAADARACAEALNEALVAENIEISSARRDWVTSLVTRIADCTQQHLSPEWRSVRLDMYSSYTLVAPALKWLMCLLKTQWGQLEVQKMCQMLGLWRYLYVLQLCLLLKLMEMLMEMLDL